MDAGPPQACGATGGACRSGPPRGDAQRARAQPVDLTAELTGLMLRAKGGGWVEVPITPVTLNSLEMVRRQLPSRTYPSFPASMTRWS
jgi:hypothetical protein